MAWRSFPGQPDADAVMEIISKYADIRDREGLLGELNAHFYDAAVPDSPEDFKLHLTDMIRPELLSLTWRPPHRRKPSAGPTLPWYGKAACSGNMWTNASE